MNSVQNVFVPQSAGVGANINRHEEKAPLTPHNDSRSTFQKFVGGPWKLVTHPIVNSAMTVIASGFTGGSATALGIRNAFDGIDDCDTTKLGDPKMLMGVIAGGIAASLILAGMQFISAKQRAQSLAKAVDTQEQASAKLQTALDNQLTFGTIERIGATHDTSEETSTSDSSSSSSAENRNDAIALASSDSSSEDNHVTPEHDVLTINEPQTVNYTQMNSPHAQGKQLAEATWRTTPKTTAAISLGMIISGLLVGALVELFSAPTELGGSGCDVEAIETGSKWMAGGSAGLVAVALGLVYCIYKNNHIADQVEADTNKVNTNISKVTSEINKLEEPNWFDIQSGEEPYLEIT